MMSSRAVGGEVAIGRGLPAQLTEFHEFCEKYSKQNPDYAIHVSY